MYEVGKKYKVLCWVYYEIRNARTIPDEEVIWLDDKDYTIYLKSREYTVEMIYPLIDYPHNDIENGQKEKHYHVDTRFCINNDPGIIRVELPLTKGRLEYRKLKCRNSIIKYNTNVSLIKKSKLKHNCIYKGKCPHRGFDLSNTKPTIDDNGDLVIKCPLHSLKFNAKTKQLIK